MCGWHGNGMGMGLKLMEMGRNWKAESRSRTPLMWSIEQRHFQ